MEARYGHSQNPSCFHIERSYAPYRAFPQDVSPLHLPHYLVSSLKSRWLTTEWFLLLFLWPTWVRRHYQGRFSWLELIAKHLIPRYRTLLSNLNLPDLCSLLLSALPGSLSPRIIRAVPPTWSFLKTAQSSTLVSAHENIYLQPRTGRSWSVTQN